MQKVLVTSTLVILVLACVGILFFIQYVGGCGCEVDTYFEQTIDAIELTNAYVETAVRNTQIARTLTATARGTNLSSIERTARAQATNRAITATHREATALPR